MEAAGAIAIVTGASSGIGACIATDLTAAGASVALVARRVERLGALAASLPAGRAHAFPCDVRNGAAVTATVDTVRKRLGPIDILVNNAGVGRYRTFLETSAEEAATILETNLYGALYFVRAVLPEMLARHRGHIVNVGSIAGRIGSRNHAIYCASKFALAGLSESLIYELDGTGVGITLVNPGIIDTPFFSHESFARFPARARGRAIPPEAVSAAVLRALRSGASEVTVPRHYAAGTLLKTIAPGLFRRLMRRVQ